ncbi:MAG: ThiF family adenylyltransferase [Parcubacteria group bacterium]
MEDELYAQLTNRNIGVITKTQQEKLKNSCVAVFGMGGLGEVVAELLVRSGIGKIKIIDNDKLEATNLNRDVFSFRSTLGEDKIDVAEKFLKDINSELILEKYDHLDEENIGSIFSGCDVAVLAIDKAKPVIIIGRKAAEMKIPLVEGWAIPFTNVRVFGENTNDLETEYDLPTAGKKVTEISEEEFNAASFAMLKSLLKIEGLSAYYNGEAIKRIMANENPSFAPLVWQTSCAMSLETIKVILRWGKIAWAPDFYVYDPFTHKIPKS